MNKKIPKVRKAPLPIVGLLLNTSPNSTISFSFTLRALSLDENKSSAKNRAPIICMHNFDTFTPSAKSFINQIGP